MPAFRKLLASERSVYRAHLLRLDAADRYSRFGGTATDETITNHCRHIDWRRTIIIGAFVHNRLCGVAEICTDSLLWPDNAEVALSVERHCQAMGVGAALLRRALTIASNRGVRTVHMICLAENRRMRRLAQRAGGRAQIEVGEVAVTFDLARTTPLSLMLEAMEDGAAAFSVTLDRWYLAVPRRAGAGLGKSERLAA
jgi:GNAT superfamily N-acetyltransferase